MRTEQGSSSAAIVAILALVILAGAGWYFLSARGGSDVVVHETEVHETKIEEKPDPIIEIDFDSDDEKRSESDQDGSK